MAPGLIETPTACTDPVDRAIFPDGLKTSGQQPPLYSLIQPYEKFPKEVAGATVWKAEDFRDNTEKWVHAFTPDEVAEIGAAADNYIDKGLLLTGITKV